MATPFLLSHDGVELQFATNHIGMSFMVNAPYFCAQHLRVLYTRNNFFTDRVFEDIGSYFYYFAAT